MERIGIFTKEETLTANDSINAKNEFDINLKVYYNSEIIEIIAEKNDTDGSDRYEGSMSGKIEIMNVKEPVGSLEKIMKLFKTLPEAEPDDMKEIFTLK
ncbi:MAG: hypothetical protein MHPSP_004297, partial [Paramarteilia canceri]